MANTIRKLRRGTGICGVKGERMIIRNFKTNDAMHKFLNTGGNALEWQEVREGEPTKSGTYAYAGQEWHNVKSLDAMTLAHI